MKKVTILVFVYLFLITPVFAFTIDLKVKESAGIARSSEYVTSSVPIPQNASVTSTSSMKITTDQSGNNAIPAQFEVIGRYDDEGDGGDSGDPIRLVKITFAADVSADSETMYYLQTTGGSGTTTGSNIISDQGSYYLLDNGMLQIQLKKGTGFNVFDSVVRGGTPVLSNPASDGLVFRVGGNDYTSYNSDDAPIIIVEENGPLLSIISVAGKLETSSNSELTPVNGTNPSPARPIEYKIWYKIYKDADFIHMMVTIKNENDGYCYPGSCTHDNFNIDYAYIKTTLDGLGTPTAVRFGPGEDGGLAFSDPSASGSYTIDMNHPAHDNDHTLQDDFQAMSYDVGKVGSLTTNNADRFDSYAQMRDGNVGIMVASRWFWENYWKEIQFDTGNKEARFYLWADEAFDQTFMGGTWKTHELIYQFHGNVPADYGFPELLTLKDRLRIYPSTIHSSGFYFRLPPVGMTSSTIFNNDPNQKLQAAIDVHLSETLAKFDVSAVTSSAAIYQGSYMTEAQSRPFTWASGIYSGNYINWFGWRNFGDLPRSPVYGFGAQNYDWIFVAETTALLQEDNAVYDWADLLARHYGDMLIIHNPTTYTYSVVPSGATSVDEVHGAQRPEMDALSYKNGFTATEAPGWYNEPKFADHKWTGGFFQNYMLSGNPWHLDVIEHLQDHALYMTSDTPRHRTQTSSTQICTSTHECFPSCVQTRAYSRFIPSLIGGWIVDKDQATSVADINAAKGIFTNAFSKKLLTCAVATCSLNRDHAHVGYDANSVIDLLMLWDAVNEAGQNSIASSIEDHILGNSDWMISQWSMWPYTVGSYDGHGNYFPYQTSQDFDCPGVMSGLYMNGYLTYPYSDAFAFLYERTGNQSWLDLSRNVYKDFWAYNSAASNGQMLPINTADPMPVRGVNEIQSSHLKRAKEYRQGLYALSVIYDAENIHIGDEDQDNDVDGKDLAIFIGKLSTGTTIYTIEEMAAAFGFYSYQ